MSSQSKITSTAAIVPVIKPEKNIRIRGREKAAEKGRKSVKLAKGDAFDI